MSPQLRVCSHCRAHNQTAKHWIPCSTHSISSLAATPSVAVLGHLNLLVHCQKACFSSPYGGTVIFQLSLDLLGIRSHAEVSSKDRNPPGKSFDSQSLERWFKLSYPALSKSFGPQTFCACAHLNVSFTGRLYRFTLCKCCSLLLRW